MQMCFIDLKLCFDILGVICSHQCSRHRAFDPEGILPPKEGRNIAKESNLVYYETSSYTLYGVQEVFDNVVRAALIYRRQHRFWQSNLKKVCLSAEKKGCVTCAL